MEGVVHCGDVRGMGKEYGEMEMCKDWVKIWGLSSLLRGALVAVCSRED